MNNNNMWIEPHTGVINRRTGEYTVFHDRWVSKVYWKEQGTDEDYNKTFVARFGNLRSEALDTILSAIENTPDLVLKIGSETFFIEGNDMYFEESGGSTHNIEFDLEPKEICALADVIVRNR